MNTVIGEDKGMKVFREWNKDKIGSWIKEVIEEKRESDPCGGRSCDECEIGGCDHGNEC